MTIKVLYYAQLADLAGKSNESFELADSSAETLYKVIQAQYHFPYSFKQLQVAINHQLSAHETPLNEGDEIAFLPPMTGG